MQICAVVVTYNRRELLEECVGAILAQTRRPDRILVIDNASMDGTSALFQEGGRLNHEIVDYRRMNENLGGAGGFYEGIRNAYHAGMDWIWIMDDDTIPETSALEELLRAKERICGDISFLASAVYGSKGEPMNVPDLDYRESATGYPDWYYWLNDGIVKVESATFVSILINRNAVDRVGFPYKELFIWGDDKEYTLRMSHHYAPGYMVGKSIVLHKRTIAKRISIEYERDVGRIDQFYYNYRNILINMKYYRRGTISVLKRIVGFEALCVHILRDKEQVYKWRKVFVIQKGILGYYLGTYNKRKFKNRFAIQ